MSSGYRAASNVRLFDKVTAITPLESHGNSLYGAEKSLASTALTPADATTGKLMVGIYNREKAATRVDEVVFSYATNM
jgi:hypothetical protein